jgi:radical SAM protein with 4Fe4S-binding SPASM domain
MRPDLPVVREMMEKGLAAGRSLGKAAYRAFGLDFRFPPKEPKYFDMELSNRCNLYCKMCWFHGDRGIGDRYENRELTSQEVFRFVDRIAKYDPNIYIGGTEPFVRSDFLPILSHMKSRKIPVSFTTNGLLLNDDTTEELLSIGVDSICFSIDGSEEIHDRERGKGAFGKATSVIRKISEIKKRECSTKPIVHVNMTITNRLLGGIGNAIHSIRNSTKDGIDSLVIHHLRYLTPNELSKHRSRVRRSLGCHAPGAASHLVPDYQISDPVALADEIVGFREWPKISMFPDLGYMDLVHYYSEGPCSKKRCTAPLRGVVIKPNGDVLFCPDEWIDDYVLGNIREQDIAEIWNGEKARKFRSALYREKHFPACKRCSWMYAFG